MRKFLQWGLVVIVAIVLLAVVVGQMLATSTGRARDASVAVLKEKLARLEAERAAAAPVAVFDVAPVAGNDPSRATIDADALPARWIALLEKIKEVSESCEVSREVRWAASVSVINPEAPEWDKEVRESLLEYQVCIEPTMVEMRTLRDLEPGLGALFDMDDLRKDRNTDQALWRLYEELRRNFWSDAFFRDSAGVVDTFTSLSYLGTFAFGGFGIYSSGAEKTASWILLKPAIEDRAVEEVRLNRLLDVLSSLRSHPHFLAEVRRKAESIIEDFETWGDAPPAASRLSRDPVGYARSWAYPRLTPALFNHDFDRFNRAMERLLDLSAKPYYEVKGDLERFYDDFDVEPDIESIKFTRGNPGWYYVLSLSRHELEQNARSQALIDVIRFAILLEKHKRDNGNYPESLEVFAYSLGGSVPVNPLLGDSYVYERTEESFQLGFRQETSPKLVKLGIEPITVSWWHDPLGGRLQAGF